jgi:hypothetical protein
MHNAARLHRINHILECHHSVSMAALQSDRGVALNGD